MPSPSESTANVWPAIVRAQQVFASSDETYRGNNNNAAESKKRTRSTCQSLSVANVRTL